MLTLYTGNRNYSSWSLRAWLLLRAFEVPFDDRRLELFSGEFRATLAPITPTGRVPVLVDDGFAVWDSLAIAEYVAEYVAARGDGRTVWPRDPRQRARARSICAEMHAGFGALRSHLPMNIEADLPAGLWPGPVRADIARIVSMWRELRDTGPVGGPFLFGGFSAADAFYAPVVTRFVSYRVAVPTVCADYMRAVQALPAMREWRALALAEHRFLPEDEPYRDAPAASAEQPCPPHA